jgi:hypothetical protein
MSSEVNIHWPWQHHNSIVRQHSIGHWDCDSGQMRRRSQYCHVNCQISLSNSWIVITRWLNLRSQPIEKNVYFTVGCHFVLWKYRWPFLWKIDIDVSYCAENDRWQWIKTQLSWVLDKGRLTSVAAEVISNNTVLLSVGRVNRLITMVENRGEFHRAIGMLGGGMFRAMLKLRDKMHQNSTNP